MLKERENFSHFNSKDLINKKRKEDGPKKELAGKKKKKKKRWMIVQNYLCALQRISII